MPNKAYAILLEQDENDRNLAYLYFPVKSIGYAYAGMPQFFGGTKDGNETDLQTIVRETREESDQQVIVRQLGPLMHTAFVGGFTYNFYVVTAYAAQYILGPLNPGEMAEIRRFPVRYSAGSHMGHLLNSMGIVAPGVVFQNSETYQAFQNTIAWSETP